METTKQKAIRKAYEDLKVEWDWISLFIDFSNGFTFKTDIRLKLNQEDLEIINNQIGTMWRPKSIQGIETNNGWISIESESDLPKENGFYWIIDKSKNMEICRYYGKEDLSYRVWITQFTHYQPIIKPEPPIY